MSTLERDIDSAPISFPSERDEKLIESLYPCKK